MALTKAPADRAAHRRERVAHYRICGYTEQAIADALADEGLQNDQGEPWSRVTVHNDLERLRTQYALNAASSIEEWIEQEKVVMDAALAHANKAVTDGVMVVTGYEEKETLDGKVKRVPVYERRENEKALQVLVQVAESRRKLLGIDRYFKLQSGESKAEGLADLFVKLQENPDLIPAMQAMLTTLKSPANE